MSQYFFSGSVRFTKDGVQKDVPACGVVKDKTAWDAITQLKTDLKATYGEGASYCIKTFTKVE